LRYLDPSDELHKIEDTDEKEIIIDTYFKGRTGVKKAKFALIQTKYSNFKTLII
jgi:hypothetical protein